jgi:hypothetical protein
LARRSEELAPNPALMIFPLAALNLLPPAVHHTLVCLSINHYIHSLPVGADKSITTSNRSKIYQHRGAAIRALSQYVGKDRTSCNDLSISSILVFMSMEVSSSHALYSVFPDPNLHSCKILPWATGAPMLSVSISSSKCAAVSAHSSNNRLTSLPR